MKEGMTAWSEYFQNPDYLERTRIQLILDEYRPLILKWCGLKDGMKALDVGCGTGYFTRFLGEGEEEIEWTGIDLDINLITAAKTLTKGKEKYTFVVGNALQLPFPDDYFDVVCSHTFFHAMEDPVAVMKEMKRVCKPGGRISTISPMGFHPAIQSSGHYPKECTWKEELEALEQKLWNAYEAIHPMKDLMKGLAVNEVPYFFSKMGLSEVAAYPIGKFFSLSNAATPSGEKQRYIELLYQSEKDKLEVYRRIPEFAGLISPEEQDRYLQLLSEKCRFLKEHPNENQIWEGSGGANLLTVGRISALKNMKWLK